jgi:hypothetical protein
MSLILSGTDGVSDIDGSAATPAIRGTDTNTGIFFPAADTIAFAEGGVESARFDSAGNLGIGTSSPINLLTVQTAATGTTAGSNVIARLQSNASGRDATLQFSDNVANSVTISMLSGATVFRQNGTESTRITSSGQLLLNNTGGAGFSGRVVSVGAVNNDAFAGEVPSGSTGGGTCYVGKISNTTAFLAYWLYGSSNVGTITSNGSTTAYNTTSDYRLKEQVQPMTGALAKVQQLKPCTYKWKADGSDGEGFIAHELQAVVPDAVTGEKDAVDEDGKPKYQGIDTSFLVATLTAAIQEQQALIQTLTARVEALEGAQQ